MRAIESSVPKIKPIPTKLFITKALWKDLILILSKDEVQPGGMPGADNQALCAPLLRLLNRRLKIREYENDRAVAEA